MHLASQFASKDEGAGSKEFPLNWSFSLEAATITIAPYCLNVLFFSRPQEPEQHFWYWNFEKMSGRYFDFFWETYEQMNRSPLAVKKPTNKDN